jgi:hypothetical protein
MNDARLVCDDKPIEEAANGLRNKIKGFDRQSRSHFESIDGIRHDF